ncbi:TetR/AcrR family transcriptional regulator [Halobium salinum]|uniref:TetR/AcrR family transcriptional regulator n=1 Tax=Halobium salinum TaxID=1364940 RepID=A0ABD5P9S6_9EURY|nr:TetR/AcrR family transcriptional regulator [Halobium salinum]
MAATYRAVCTEGYADLTMRDIAEEAGKSKSLLHYHYDTKEGLLVAFLDHMLSRFEADVEAMDGESPTERLAALVGKLSSDTTVGADEANETDEERRRFHRALLELRTQAPCHEAYRQQLARNKAAIQDRFADVIREGVETGEFRAVDPERAARFVLAALDGARNAHVALGDADDPPAVRASIAEFLGVDSGFDGESDFGGEPVDDSEAEE